MPIYGKRFNAEQRDALQEYEQLSGFEPMHQDDFDAGDISFFDLWNTNIQWLEGVLASVVNIQFDSQLAEYIAPGSAETAQ